MTNNYEELYQTYFWHQITQMKTSKPIFIQSAQGVKLKDVSGMELIDLMSGQGNVILGYGQKEVAQAMYEKAVKLAFVPVSIFVDPDQLFLAQKLAQILPAGLKRTFLQSSGSDANEAAIKMARQFQHQNGNPAKYKVISLWTGYHGATFGALGATGRMKRRVKFEPLMPGFLHVFPPNCYRCYFGRQYPNCDIDCAKQVEYTIAFEGAETVAAFIAEPFTTSGGPNVPPKEYFQAIDQICKKNDILLVLDEIVTGFGRTGAMFATTHYPVKPDIITLGKGITGGYAPLSAVCTREEIYQAFFSDKEDERFNHIITYGGNPVSTAAALKTIEIIERDGLVARTEEMGRFTQELLRQKLEGHPLVGNIVGRGLHWGMDLVKDRKSKEPLADTKLMVKFKQFTFSRGVGAQLVGGDLPFSGVFSAIMPPLVITKEELDYSISVIKEALDELVELV